MHNWLLQASRKLVPAHPFPGSPACKSKLIRISLKVEGIEKKTTFQRERGCEFSLKYIEYNLLIRDPDIDVHASGY